MTATALTFRGESLLLDSAGILFWPGQALLAVADLHLEKGSACAGRGQLVPPWDSRETLGRLSRLAALYAPRVIVALGDSFHDGGGAARLAAGDRAALDRLGAARLVWVRGNHDPEWPAGLPGEAAADFRLGGLVFRHQAAAGAAGEISGHFHPKARVTTRAGDIVRPCFVADSTRLMLPAFGAYTGGLDVGHPAIQALYPAGATVFLLGREKLFRFTIGEVAPAGPAHRFCA